MSTDWGALMDQIMPNQPQKAGKDGLFQEKPGTNPGPPGTDLMNQATDKQQKNISVPGVPSVPSTFEKVRPEHCANAVPSSFSQPVEDGVGDACAPEKIGFIPSCSCCAHRMRPGLSDGLCGGDREDLPYAFTPGHPLRRLPLDGGADCPKWGLHWSYRRVLLEGSIQGTESPVFCVGSGSESW